jgi:hypothetical protein
MKTKTQKTDIKKEVIKALTHPEADEGLFLYNFNSLDEGEDHRQIVHAEETEIVKALEELIRENKVTLEASGDGRVIFRALQS